MQVDRIKKARQRRKYRNRKKVFGSPDRPRLTIFRSGRHIYAQIIDDIAGVTLASANTKSKSLQSELSKTGNIEAAKKVGAEIAKNATQVGIKAVRFDRGRYKYHGRIRALADSAREAGLVF